MWRAEEPAEEGPALWVGVASLGAGRAETKGPAGEELPTSPWKLPNGWEGAASEGRGLPSSWNPT